MSRLLDYRIATTSKLASALLLFVACSHGAIALVPLVMFVVFDILDGYLARRQGLDSSARRLLDSIGDRVTVHVSFALLVAAGACSPFIWLPILLRDLMVGIPGIHYYLRGSHHSYITGGGAHKLSSLSCALLFAILVVGNQAYVIIVGTTLLAWSINLLLALDFLGAYLDVRGVPTQASSVLVVSDLAGLRYLLGRLRLTDAEQSEPDPA